MTQHVFTMDLAWANGRNGTGTIQAANLQTQISIPREMNGPGIGTNPDEMLLGAAATCYLITLAALLENAQMAVQQLTMTSQGIVDVTNGIFTYKEIIHQPVVVIANLSEHEYKRIQRFVEKAEQTCMISKALKGNVMITCKATIQNME
ncbi:SACOL1771 family peroxiredoxin [Lysinibacillus piscis]|uniref:SACOL1771 family peroxiredoxin n=1 Tax=Lysinibacillus piscis TaxID=2518931 RepID=A0ABQ5NNT6_9BACI|nr:SACOL1771 family peroxiredoxin [Lysinibacillus sp. KH24]GLC89778.1 hypothetical protein LYSBPC_29050 [Lysinibacillus sp. KH24]